MNLTRAITRAITQSVTQSLTSPPIGGGGSFTPDATFFAGAAGVAYDFSDASKLYTDTGRTTLVTTAGDLIASATDLSGNGKHASQSTESKRFAWQTTYAAADGTNDALVTPSIDFTGTDEITVIACVHKASGGGFQALMELGSAGSGRNLAIYAPTSIGSDYGFYLNGATLNTARIPSISAPDTSVISWAINRSEATKEAQFNALRRNGAAVTPTFISSTAASAGNFINAILYIGSREGSSLFLNGRIYRMVVIGRLLTAGEIAQCEAWCADPAGVSLP